MTRVTGDTGDRTMIADSSGDDGAGAVFMLLRFTSMLLAGIGSRWVTIGRAGSLDRLREALADVSYIVTRIIDPLHSFAYLDRSNHSIGRRPHREAA